ncbi:MAG: ABC transporter permease [Bacteroidetes bacterium]|nr:MAG: ABC transporter permease [Bacteroidota bacterium]
MQKLWLIIQREYLVRVKRRSFILVTILTPLAFVLLSVVVVFIFQAAQTTARVAVVDESGIVGKGMKDSELVFFKIVDEPLDTIKRHFKERGYDGVLHIPSLPRVGESVSVVYYSDKQLPLSTQAYIEDELARKFREYKVAQSGYDKAILESFETRVDVLERSLAFTETGEVVEEDKTGSSVVATVLGMVMGFIIYIVLFIYGTMVMRSVMEEKINRIVEVIISSVKPFQLMLGKIIGVSGVGLTQFVIWIVLLQIFMFIAGLFLPLDALTTSQPAVMGEEMPQTDLDEIMQVLQAAGQLNWWLIVPLFLIYFLGGYLIYASLFAAVGSAVGDDLGESQSLTLPITIPVILAIYIMMAVIENPESSLATWSSLVPLFSPIVMPARLPFDPPLWEIVASLVILLASAVFFIWLSGRIYRVGILMYGKKVGFKEIWKWMRHG